VSNIVDTINFVFVFFYNVCAIKRMTTYVCNGYQKVKRLMVAVILCKMRACVDAGCKYDKK